VNALMAAHRVRETSPERWIPAYAGMSDRWPPPPNSYNMRAVTIEPPL
jgi:hypothetical protein